MDIRLPAEQLRAAQDRPRVQWPARERRAGCAAGRRRLYHAVPRRKAARASPMARIPPPDRLAAAFDALKQGRLPDAERLARALAKERPGDARPHALLGRI